jgi:hypothetical protein
MALDLMPLINDFNAYFLGLYHQAAAPPSGARGSVQTSGGQAPGNTTGSPAGATPTTGATQANGTKAGIGPFLAFANLGTPITPDMFMLKDGTLYDGLAVEQFSTLANALPTIQDGSIMGAGLLTVDGLYSLMLEQAQAVSASDMEAFGAVRRDAQKAFDATLPGRTPGVGEFHPAIPTPTDWPFPTAAAAWSSRVFEQTQTVAAAPTPSPPPSTPPVPRPPVPQAITPRPWTWHVAPDNLAETIGSVQAVRANVPPHQIVLPPAKLNTHPVALRPMLAATMVTRNTQFSAADTGAAPAIAAAHPVMMSAVGPMVMTRPNPAVAPPPTVSATFVRSDVMMLHVAALSQQSVPQAVTAKSLKLSFDYCVVRATRPWLSPGLLALRNWYVPHTKAGEFASGTGTGTGSFEVMPMAALVVKNLVIEADWSSEETAVLGKLDKFGPFSLVGRSVSTEKNALHCEGMQIVGWVFEPMPCLPPAGDPAIG